MKGLDSPAQRNIMNDPVFTASFGKKGKGIDEPDTCRICRGEGSDEEELFYPCKCSGSIKFVHQSCLMEWLSHSQKKYCELCKTPFRFTKLYDPNMPKELPAPVFLKELMVHVARSLLMWLRFLLVAFVWLGWLPWSMRAVWRGLFWLADGRWPISESVQATVSFAGREGLSSLAAQGTSPVTQLFASSSPATASPAQSLQTAVPQFLFPVSSILNLTAGEPLIYSIAKRLLANAVVLTTSVSIPTSTSDFGNVTASATRRLRQPSWLSDIEFLNGLTPYPTINNILIDTLEGQLITLLVVVLFIHVFLIREWVIQQQPAINLAEGEREVAGEVPREHRVGPVAEPEPARTNEAEQRPPEGEVLATPSQTGDGNGIPNVNERMADDPTRFEETAPVFENVFNGNANVAQLTTPESGPSQQLSDTATSATGSGLDLNRHFDAGWSFGFEDTLPVQPSTEPTRRHENKLNLEEQTPGTLRDNEHRNFHNTPASNIIASQVENDSKVPDQGPSSVKEPIEAVVGLIPEDRSSLQRESSSSLRIPESAVDGQIRRIAPLPPVFGNNEPNLPGNRFDFRSTVEFPAMQAGANGDDSDRPLHLPATGDSQNAEVLGTGLVRPNETPDTSSARVMELRRPEEQARIAHAPRSLKDRVVEWFWGGVALQPEQEDEGNDDEHIVEDPAREQPFVPVRHGQHVLEANAGAGNDFLNRPAAPANEGVENDIDAVDDADDLEGVMELIGMHGAIFGLLQNGVFSALLISFTVTIGIWLPYLWGKIALVLLTNPIRLFIGIPLAIFSIIADFAVDTVIGSFAYLVYIGNILIRALLGQIGKIVPVLAKFSASNAVTHASLSLIDGSGQRLKRIMTTFFTFRESDVPMFSVLAHQALRIHQARISAIYQFCFQIARMVVYDIPLHILRQEGNQSLLQRLALADLTKVLITTVNALKDVVQAVYSLLKYGNLNISVDYATSASLDSDLAYWDTKDRIIAIVVGYCFASFIGLSYLRLSTYFSGEQRGQRVNGAVAEVLHQAGGVLKVILIIGIEMIVFPLYCGILLDIALMPLFENVTFGTRLAFAMGSPLTSLFVHWFIGTCYMFHFALFVSMCRKIMRNGVLYFIRDPDDPTFHPVRDVLERNVSTQLRKIAFSALVYGALVIICMGGVVWGLSFALRGVLPLHWSSNEPVLEFPVDLLFYNLVMPFAIRSIKPSDILHKMYDWWFRKCARLLRLTDFLFGERQKDEEGYYGKRTWTEMLSRGETDFSDPSEDHGKEQPGDSANFIHDGRFVRTPASDQVRIPKGTPVFLEVNGQNERLDGEPDHDEGLHGKANDMFTKVYVPPRFKTRIAAFIFLIWVFAATTGVGATLVPLVAGRRLISFLFPANTRINDLYAFSVGLYCLGGIAYVVYHKQRLAASLHSQIQVLSSPPRFLQKALKTVSYIAKIVYTFGAFGFVIPTFFAIVAELYFLIPIHTYLNSEETHIIHFVQDWTLGVLYTRMAARLMLRNDASRSALALKAIIRNGWLHPDVKFATRAFIVPATLTTVVAVMTPLPIGFMLNATVFRGEPAAVHSQVYRYSYPGFLLLIVFGWGLHLLQRQIHVWRMSIRDDVYLIGERLHNFGERRVRDMGAARRMINAA
ncbi:RING-variant-domain-containing protein [Emydomyces testavorans]|uniref:RING-type E3 ubiquitin transferase n=1 Tax=Emydomyces testavorans TaxID=2070801 RepID=A0AAF0DFY7_9EURO|nr:RING-variant-domain-containing protein [Emydomyces testavorans]